MAALKKLCVALALLAAPFASAVFGAPENFSDDPEDPPEQEAERPDAVNAALDLADALKRPEFWLMKPEDFAGSSKYNFEQGLCKTEMLYAKGRKSSVDVFGMPAQYCVLRFEGQRLKDVYALFAFAESEKAIPQLRESAARLRSALAEELRTPAKESDYRFPKARVAKALEWNCPAARASLRYNDSLPGGYLALELERPDSLKLGFEKKLAAKRSYFDELSREAVSNGKQTILAVPMRRQLPGIGACWSSTFTRQMAYLGSEIEPMAFSQMVGGDEDKLFDEMSGKLCMYRKKYSLCGRSQAGENALELLSDYNEEAKKAGFAPVKFSERDAKIFFGDNFMGMKREILAKCPAPDKKSYELFREIVKSALDQKLPVSWTVVRWAPKKSGGGSKHRRLIVGMDLEKDLLYFSDTWGFSFERRAMDMRAAFAMTVWMQIVSPSWIPPSKFPKER